MSAPPDGPTAATNPALGGTSPIPSFSAGQPGRDPSSPAAWLVAAAVILLLIAALFLFSRHRGGAPANSILPLDAYAAQLPISNVVMSESTSLSGGKSTFIDGTVRNTGTSTVAAASVQVLFAHDDGMPPQVETVPLSLIRTREPYVDTEPLARTPLAPGTEREFRLIFEDITQNWNQALPAIHVVATTTR